MKPRIRINRFLACSGLGSRRKCEELIRRGTVTLNGVIVERLSIEVDPETDEVKVDGQRVAPSSKSIVLVINKPAGVLSTVTDSHGRRTVIDIAGEQGYRDRLFPVGRLDLDTTGILILTNDGNLAYRLTHPGFKVEKTYHVSVENEVTDKSVTALESGIRKGSFETQPCKVRILKRRKNRTELEVVLKEGKKRQVRRMFAILGYRVAALHRKALGNLEFNDLNIGDIRPLTVKEENRLRELTGLI